MPKPRYLTPHPTLIPPHPLISLGRPHSLPHILSLPPTPLSHSTTLPPTTTLAPVSLPAMDPIEPHHDAAAAANYARKGKAKVVSEEVESEERPPGPAMEERWMKEEARWSGYCPGPLAPELEESVGDIHHPPVLRVFVPPPPSMVVHLRPPTVATPREPLHPRARVCRKKKCARKRVAPYYLLVRRDPLPPPAPGEVIQISSDSDTDMSGYSSYSSPSVDDTTS